MDDYKIITPKLSKKPIKYRAYVTGSDEEAVKEIILSASDIRVEVGKDGAQHRHIKVDPTANLKLERLLVIRFVTEVDGSNSGVVDKVYELLREDKNEVIAALNDLIKPIMDEINKEGEGDPKKA